MFSLTFILLKPSMLACSATSRCTVNVSLAGDNKNFMKEAFVCSQDNYAEKHLLAINTTVKYFYLKKTIFVSEHTLWQENLESLCVISWCK